MHMDYFPPRRTGVPYSDDGITPNPQLPTFNSPISYLNTHILNLVIHKQVKINILNIYNLKYYIYIYNTLHH
jgi:hypothetical protein